MMRARVGVGGFVLLASLLAAPSAVLAQSTIAGIVKDNTGGALPGVTVEAASPALIEGSKTATTDGAGLYRIVDLRPGIYTVTFSLTGFATIKQERVELPAQFTFTANAEMKISTLSETVTVTAGAPLVDVQSAARVQTVSKEQIENVPTSRTIQTMGQLIVGVRVEVGNPDVGGANATEQSYMSVRGIPSTQNTVMVDGLVVNGLESNGAIQNYFNDASMDQIVYQTSDTTASNSGGGVQVNMISRAGGNRFSGDSQLAYRPGSLAGDNLSRHAPTGIVNPPGSKFISDVNVAQGGPIKKDKFWFFASARDNRVTNYVLDTILDDGSRGYDDNYVRDVLGRLTYQLNKGGKLQGYYDKIWKFKGHEMGSNTNPETAAGRRTTPDYRTGSIKYTLTATSRLLLEAGYSFNHETRTTVSTGGYLERNPDPLSAQSAANYQTNDWYSHVGRRGAGAASTSVVVSIADQFPTDQSWLTAVSYITGSHNIKGGFGMEQGHFYHRSEAHGDIFQNNYASYTRDPVNNNFIFATQPCAAVLLAQYPNCKANLSSTIANTPVNSQETMNRNGGFYIQDQWTIKRLTVNAGIRYEFLNSQVDASTAAAGRFVPARTQAAVTDRPDWKTWVPRFSTVFDVFGTGKTAVKYSVNRYQTGETVSIAASQNVLGTSNSTRQWTDLNGDDIAQGQRTWNADGTSFTDCVYQTPGCEIYLTGSAGVSPTTGVAQTLAGLSPTFGLPGDVAAYSGFDNLYRIEHSIEVQQQLLPRLGVTFGWTRWDRHNNTKTVNQFRQAPATDYRTVQFYDPIDGAPLPFLYYDITAEASTRQQAAGANITVIEPKLKVFYDGFQTEFRSRPWAGAQLAGGITFEKTLTTNCETSVPGLFVDPNTIRFCDQTDLLGDGSGVTLPYLKNFKVNFSSRVFYGFTLGIVYQNLDESGFTRTFNYGRVTQRYPDGTSAYRDSTGAVAPAVGCPAGQAVCPVPGALTGPATLTSAADINLQIDTPGLKRDERLNQIDIKLSKNFRVGRTTMAPTFEAFNLFNADTILGRNQVYMNSGFTYLRPSNILKPRLFGFGYFVKW